MFTTGDVVDFQSVFFILAGTFFVLGIIGCLLIRLPSADYIQSLNLPAAQTTKVKSYTLGQALKSVPFWCIFFSILFINGTWTLSVPLIYDQGIAHGLSAAAALTALSMTGVFNALGRLVMAAVSDKIGRVTTIIVLSVLTVIGAGLMILNVRNAGYIIAIFIIAFGYGGPASTNAAITTDFFGPKKLRYELRRCDAGARGFIRGFQYDIREFPEKRFYQDLCPCRFFGDHTIILMLIINVCLKRK
jgi:OFA family oxalate/formate antiporter-like MFS transporter